MSGTYSSGTYTETYQFVGEFVDRVTAPADQASVSLDNLGIAATDMSAQVKSATDAVSAGLEKTAASANNAAARGFNTLQRSIDPLGAALRRAEADLTKLNARIAAGGSELDKYTSLLPVATAKVADLRKGHELFLDNLSKTEGQTRQVSQGLRIMSLQIVDVVQGLGSGMPIWQTFIQQGGQVYQVAQLMNVGLRDVGTYLAALISPGKLAVTSIVAVGAAMAGMAIYAEATNRRLGELRAQLSASRTDFETMAASVEKSARQVAAATSASFKEASAAAQTLGSTRAFVGTQQDLADLTKTAVDLAKVMGTDIPAASKLLAQAMTNPSAALKTLSEGEKPLRTVTVALRLQVDELVRVGKFAEAAKLAIDALKTSSSEAPKQMTPLQDALHQLSTAFNKTGEDGRSFAQAIGEAITSAAATAVTMLKEMVEVLEKLRTMKFPEVSADQTLDIPGIGTWGPSAPSGMVRGVGQWLSGSTGQQTSDAKLDYIVNALRFQYPSLYSQSGPPLVNPQSGATGMMQMIPGTQQMLGFTPGFVGGSAGNNMIAGLSYMNQLYERGLSPAGIGNVYGGATSGPAQAARQSDLSGAKIGNLPPDVVGGIEFIGQIFGWPDWLIKLAKQTAYVESKGQQFQGGSTAAAGGGSGATAPADRRGSAGSSIYGGGQDEAAGQRGIELVKNIKIQSDEVKRLKLELDDMTVSRQKAHDAGQPEQEKRITDAITIQKDAIANAENVLRKETQALQDQGKVAGIVGQANKELAQIYLEAARARESGRGASDAQVQGQVAALTEKQTQAFSEQNKELDINIAAADKLAAAWTGGADAAAKAAAQEEAHKQVLATLATATHDVAAAEADRTQKLLQVAAGQEKVKAAQEGSNIRDTISLLQLENSTLGENADQRALAIQHLRDEQELRKLYPNLIAAGNTELIAERDQLAATQQAYREHQQNLDYLAGQFSSAFDTIGNAITEAFVSGDAHAVNFANVMKSVVSQIIQQFLRLAVINPIINSLFGGMGGQSMPTLFSVFDAVGGGSALGGGGSGGGGGTLLQGAGLARSAFGNPFSGNGLIGSFLGQGIFGTSVGEAAAANTAAGLADPYFGYAAGSTGAFGGASIGSLAGGFGAGFGVGSLAGGFVQSALGKTGPAPQIGAGVGALAGAAIGSIIPGVGTLIGGIIGGLIGGGGGGLIGPKPKSPYSASFVGIGADGQLTVNSALSGNQLTPSNLIPIQQEASIFNQNLGNLGVRVAGTTGAPPAGDATGLGFFGTAKNPQGIAAEHITDVFSKLRFGASTVGYGAEEEGVLNRYLNDKTFQSFEELGKAVEKVRTFVERTSPTLLKFGEVAGSLNDAIANINNTFGPAIATAHELGFKEQELTAVRDAQIVKVQTEANAAFTVGQQGYAIRAQTAAAALSGDPSQLAAAQLAQFDFQAEAERKQLADNIVQVYGEAIRGTEGFVQNMAALEQALGAERLTIATQANDAILAQQKQARELAMEQARSSAAQLITSIADYTHGLKYSAASPLSPLAQLDEAQRQFNAVSGAAVAGDATSLSKLTGYSDTLLGAARQVYGSGEGYANVFRQVVETLNAVASVPVDTLTASIYQLEVRSQTQTLVDAIASLQNEVAGLRAQVAAGSAMPSRLAA